MRHVLLTLLFLMTWFAVSGSAAPRTKKIVLIAGPITGHGKNTHEYEKSVILLKHLLDTSSNLPELTVEAHFRGWPKDPQTLNDADSIVLITDGGDRKATDHPLYVGDRLQQLEKQMKRGCGLVMLHWTTFNPAQHHDRITEWVGGYFDYETGTAPNKWFSTIKTWEGPTLLATADHPITRGVQPFRVKEEFYYNIRFRDNDARVKPIVHTRPPGESEDKTVGWEVERADGGRGFGYTGGHFYDNWWLPDYRKLLLNAIVWSTKAEVPAGGVESKLDEPIRALIVTGHNHPAHDWRRVTQALIAVLEQDPRMVVHVTEQPEDLATMRIVDYDLLIMNYSSWDRPGLSAAAKKNFANYVDRGGGLAVLHFANGSFTDTLPNKESDWPEYRTKLVRRIWDHGKGKSGHDAYGPFQVRITDAGKAHPITAGLEPFDTVDELYYRQLGDLPITPLAVAGSKDTKADEPMAWAYEYGKGQIFQTVLGHSDVSVRKAGTLIRRGSVWAAKRKPLSFDPPLELTENVLFREGSPWKLEDSLRRGGLAEQEVAEAPLAAGSPDESSRRSAATIEAVKKKVASGPGLSETRAPGAAQGPASRRDAATKNRITGHWGEDAVGFRWTEQESVDNRFQQMDTGQFFTGTILTSESSNGQHTYTRKALCIRIGEKNEAAVCYDTDLVRLSDGWTGSFLTIDPARYGIIKPPKIAGEMQFSTPEAPGWAKEHSFKDRRSLGSNSYGPLPRDHARYGGLYLQGNRVVLSYSVGETEVLESPWFESIDGVPVFTRTLEVGPSRDPLELLVGDHDLPYELVGTNPAVTRGSPYNSIQIAPRATAVSFTIALASKTKVDERRLSKLAKRLRPSPALRQLTAPGPARWTAEITTRGEIGAPDPKNAPFAVDTLTLPFDNPYRALFFVSGHDFLSKDTAAICTLHGDVWLLSGIDDKLGRLRWKRFATGLFQPLGLKIVNGAIYVVGRDQITRLHDRDRNGEADYYENFNNEGQVTTNGHEYVMCLETDSHGNFYYLKGDSGSKIQHDGCLLRVNWDGSELSTFATGFRNANGMAIGPNDEITVAPQEGEWTPASGIFSVVPGGFHGAMSVHHQESPPTDYVKPICWLSRRMDNSSGGQVWVPPGSWGPLSGKMLHMSYGQCSLMLVLREEISGQKQGGVVPFPMNFQSGVMRGRFNNHDGNLYLSGLHGWVSNAAADGCFQRVRYVGPEAALPTQVSTLSNGLLVTFSEPLDKETAEDPENYRAEAWNYRWSAQYGSPELRPSQPNVEGRDRLTIESATVMGTPSTVFLEIPNLQPVSVLQLDFRVTTAKGATHQRQLSYTIHQVSNVAMPAAQMTGRRPSKYLTDVQRKSLVNGLLYRFSQRDQAKNSTDVVQRRMAVLHIAASEPPTTFLRPGPFEVVMEGFLRPAETGKFHLRATGTGSGRVYLAGKIIAGFGPGNSADEQRNWESLEHDVRGFVPIRVEYAQPAMNELAEFRLLWKREDGVEEAIPPAALFSLNNESDWQVAQQRQGALDTVIQLRCVKCHEFGARGQESMLDAATMDGPSLKSAGDRLNPQWVAAWLLAPNKLRNDATMPALLGDSSNPESQQKAAHLSAFICSLRSGTVAESMLAKTGDPFKALAQGERLWEQLGCIGCHRLTSVDTTGDLQRTSLQFVVRKYRGDALITYLQRPHAEYAATRMPDFKLNEEEAYALSMYLNTQSPPTFLDKSNMPAGDPTEGRRLAESLRCHACHDFGSAMVRDGLAMSRKRIGKFAAGCLADGSARPATTPRFHLADNQRAALVQNLSTADISNSRLCAVEESQRLFRMLRCGVCHGRDDQSSQLPSILAEEGQFGWLPESLPNLTWTGERLHASWMEQFIGGHVADRPRPHLVTRMPAFPAYAATLAHGIAAQHGIRVDAAPTSTTGQDFFTGYRLTLKDGGLDCRQCHAVGNQPAQGDDKTRLAPGINFAQVPQRLRYDFYRRFMLDPPRYEVNTRMPKLSADGRTTGVQNIYNGDAQQQFDAIWQYLQTIHGSEP